jgi:hypothetical protein
MTKYCRSIWAVAAGLMITACSDQVQVTEPEPAGSGLVQADGALESSVAASSGITSDQANASSVLGSLGSSHEVKFHTSLDAFAFLCVYTASAGRVVCPDISVGGLVFTRSWAFYDAAGNPQPRRDTSTVRINTRTSVRGTVVRDSLTVTVDRQGEMTQDGVQRSSLRRTMNGAENGTMTIVHRTARGTFRSVASHADSTINLVVPQNDTTVPRWPVSGTIVHVNSGTKTHVESGESRSYSRREVQVFNGTSRVQVTITVNGVTRTCERDLEHRDKNCR